MRICLVHPAGSNWMPGKKDVAAVANRMAPLGLLSIAAYLKQAGHEVSILDCLGPGAQKSSTANAKIIASRKPDLTGFSVTTSGFPDACDMAQAIKAELPESRVMFGGVHVSAIGGPLLRDYPAIDYLCMGEGEITALALADGKAPSNINGLVYRDNGEIIENPPAAQIQDLDELPFPAYEILDGFPGGYNLPLFSYINTPGATMITSRGCPFQCSFCDRSVFKNKYRYNSPEYVYVHMKYLQERFGVRHVNIYDDLFTTNRKRIQRICELLISKPLGMNFNCAVRAGHADDELLAMLKAAGFLMLSIGIETGDPDQMKSHKPGVTLEEITDTVKRIQARGLRAKGLFMMGLPGDTEKSIARTSDFAMSLDLDDMNMSKFTPFPGAPLWNEIVESGRFEENWREMNCLNFVYTPEDIESKERLSTLYNQHVKRFYSSAAWRNKLIKRTWQHRKSLLYMLKNIPDFLSAKKSFEND